MSADYCIEYTYEDEEGMIEPPAYHFQVDGYLYFDWESAVRYLVDSYGVKEWDAEFYLMKLPTKKEYWRETEEGKVLVV